MAEILKGTPLCAQLKEEIKNESRRLRLKGTHPKMAIVRVGEREDDISYERSIVTLCNAVDIKTEKFTLPADTPEDKLIEIIHQINADAKTHGLMMFRPLPRHIDEVRVCSQIDPLKDIDGITDASVASVFIGRGKGFAPCTAEACVRLLEHYGYEIAGKRVAIIGRSLVVGKPLSMMLLKRDATVTICHTKTRDMASICRDADILIAAAGKSRLVGADFLNENQIVLDVGFNVDGDGNVTGDINFEEAERFVSAITPVPGGVGGITTRILVEHTVAAARAALENTVNER